MQKEPIRVVITGAPGSGKTTIITHLKLKGYRVFEEISRDIIRQSLTSGSDILPWKNLKDFTREVFNRRSQQYDEVTDGLNFFDRSVIDTLAYLPLEGLSPDAEMVDWAQQNRYHPTVFITPPWKEIYNRDHERREDWKTACQIHEFICKTYEDLGYRLVFVPLHTPERRVDFILEKLGLM
ncbi:MAG: AAA family ATPase [Thermaurantimonas sp.]